MRGRTCLEFSSTLLSRLAPRELNGEVRRGGTPLFYQPPVRIIIRRILVAPSYEQLWVTDINDPVFSFVREKFLTF